MVFNKKFTRHSISVTDDVKIKIGEVLNKYFQATDYTSEELINQWYVCDADTTLNLYKVHYVDDADMVKVGNIRGTVVDLEYEMVIADFFGNTKVIQCDNFPSTNNKNGVIYKLTDFDGVEHDINSKEIVFRTYYEGPTFCFMYWKGTVFAMTHRLLQGTNGSFNQSKTFQEIMDQVGIPSHRVMFDTTNAKFSPFVYYFIPIHHSLLINSRDQLDPEKGFAVYLMHKQIWDLDKNGPFKINDPSGRCVNLKTNDSRPSIGYVELSPRKFETTFEYPTTDKQPVIYTPPNLSIKDVNYRLKNGFYSPNKDIYDNRLGMGEAVAIYCYTDGKLDKMLKLSSEALVWRTAVRGNGPLLSEFYKLTTWASRCKTDRENNISKNDIEQILEHFPNVAKLPIPEIMSKVEKGELTSWTWPPTEEDVIVTRDDVLYVVWISYLMSVPLHDQKAVVGFYDDYMKTRRALINHICFLAKLPEEEFVKYTIPKRIVQIIHEARKNINNRRVSAQAKKKNAYVSDDELMRSSISNFLYKERGDSMYSMRGYLISLSKE